MIEFLLKSTITMAVLLGLYYLLFEREKMHQFNRFFLIFALVFSLVLPFITLPLYNEVFARPLSVISLPSLKLNSENNEASANYLPFILWSIYGSITLLLAIRFIHNIRAFIKRAASGEIIDHETAKLVLLDEKILPHTFLQYIFLNKEDYENRTIEEELYTHELAHVNQKHTLDILFIETLKVFFWFNPLLYAYKKAIQLNHEFLADEKVITLYGDAIPYQNILLQKASFGHTVNLASNINFSITKKRFIMMTKKTPRFEILTRQITLIPVFGALLLISCSGNNEPNQDTNSTNVETTTPIKEDSSVYSSEKLSTQPEFPGGIAAFYKHVNTNFNIPEINQDLIAKIHVSFVVEKDGTLSDIKVLRDPGHGLGDEAVRVLKSIKDKWQPGTMNGNPIRASYTLPITINIKA
ncbi:M56 family metallopeptidase [Flavobacterium cerinum]|uniref:M56 family peptidase n=1 Tax=Flavobacterium cerinum TaxID=2502784 RepID=A0A3S3U2T3_9FLAO|nr:M56 family metallopeptidase [Flavobacterium cerinum]RWX03573.1 M56 family peptidase [Flavobacterium cerinum]